MRYWIGLGSNQGDSTAVINEALRLLADHPDMRLLRVSNLYRSAPWGDPDQPDFTNAVAELSTAAEPRALLHHLQAIERRLGRVRSGRRWGPRTIDLDILLAGERIYHLPGLTVPHRRMHRRRFVLEPLAALEPNLLIPGKGKVGSLLACLADQVVNPVAANATL